MFCRNLFASNISRNCSIGMDGDFNLVNNVMFNWWNRSVDGGDENSRLNIINNYYKPGPITPKDKPIAHRIVKPEESRDKNKKGTFGKAYVDGNIVEGNERVTKNNWDGGVQDFNKPAAGEYADHILNSQPFRMANVTNSDAT